MDHILSLTSTWWTRRPWSDVSEVESQTSWSTSPSPVWGERSNLGLKRCGKVAEGKVAASRKCWWGLKVFHSDFKLMNFTATNFQLLTTFKLYICKKGNSFLKGCRERMHSSTVTDILISYNSYIKGVCERGQYNDGVQDVNRALPLNVKKWKI